MASLRLGNHFFDEVLEVSLSKISDGSIIGIVDQITTASVDISSDNTDVTDKAGNVVYTRYTNKSGTVNMTNAFFHPVIANAQSGSDIKYAGAGAAAIVMPKMVELAPGETYDVTDALVPASIQVIGIYGNGANDVALEASTSAATIHSTYKYTEGTTKTITMPANGTSDEDTLVKYVVIYERSKESGMVLTNSANTFPKAIDVKLLCTYVDMCTKETKPAIINFPSFTPDPNMTLNFDRENANVDFNGILSTNFCSTDKELYTIYYPDEDVKIVTGGVA